MVVLTKLAILAMVLVGPLCDQVAWAAQVHDFERSAAGWDTDEVERPAQRVSTEQAKGGARSLMLGDGLLAVRRFRCTGSQDWRGATRLTYSIYIPPDAPRTVQTSVYVADSEYHWYEAMDPAFLVPGTWNRIHINLAPEPTRWRPVDHDRPWDPTIRGEIVEFGIKVFGYRVEYRGPVWLDDVRIEGAPLEPPLQLNRLRENATRIGRYELFELSFSLTHAFDNPFDPREVDITAEFIAPSGKRTRVHAFWYQNFNRSLLGVDEILTPVGRPEWKLRFTPSEVGEYRYRLRVRAADERRVSRSVVRAYEAWSRSLARRWTRLGLTFLDPVRTGEWSRFDGYVWADALSGLAPAQRTAVETAERTFTCSPSSHPGFVRVSASDPRFFEHETGEFVWPKGLNVCAAFDERNADELDVMVNRWEGSYALERYMRNMGRSKTDFARLWMACWSLAIEWGRKYDPHFHGLGRYSLENAWRLDRVFDEARRAGVLVQPTLDTFGHFRTAQPRGQRDPFMDWSYNAYAAANGGFVDEPWSFFSNPDCFDFYRRRLEYVVARWGYSPQVFGWEICNEIDLITRYDSPTLVRWHRKVCNLLHEIDPFEHPVTTNFASYLRDYDVWHRPEFDYLTSNRYVRDLPYYFAWLYEDRRLVVDRAIGATRPHFLLEAGNDFRGGDRRTTATYFHMSLWSAWMVPLAGAGTNWWWVFIDQEDVYTHATAFDAYIRGEDKRGIDWEYK